MDKNIAKEELKHLIEKYEDNRIEIINKHNHYNEATAREEYIDVFLEIFGWDIHNKKGKNLSQSDVITENFINNKNKPDYSLRRNGSIYYTIEAEKPSKDIHKDSQPASQVLRYGWSANNDIGILINFEYLQIFQTYKKPNNNKIVPWKDINYKEYLKYFDELWNLLSYNSVYNGKADSKIKSITPETATKTRLDKYFLAELDDWRILIGQDLIENDKSKYTDKTNNYKKLNDDVQEFLNQIVFLRFAEDNNLEKHKELNYVFNNYDESPLKFDKKLQSLDKKYNSGIFRNSSIAKLLNRETIHKIISNLYYPNSDYNFAVIDLNILGKIYEQFLQKQLIVKNHSKVILCKTSQANIKAIVSTPNELIKSITHHALKYKLNSVDNIHDLLNIKIADIAVGSGGFLIAAYDEIESKILELKGQKNLNFKVNIPLDIKKKIISNMLYGYDIDSHASEVTKFSLALRLLKNEDATRFNGQTPLIPSMENNVYSENSLVSEKDIEDILSKHSELLSFLNNEISEINPYKYKNKKFDVILGNPPYLDTEGMKNSSKIEFAVYKDKYISAYKQFDKYFLFIEEMMNMLNKNGVGTLLIPNKFFSIDTAYQLRNYLIDNNYLSSIINFKDKQLFKGKMNYLAIVSCSKSKNKNVRYAVANSITASINPSFNTYSYNQFIDIHGNWIFNKDSKAFALYKSMKDFPKISDEVIYKNGVQTSKNTVYIIKNREIVKINKDKNIIKFKKKNKIWTIEYNILEPFFKNINKKGTYYSQPEIDSFIIFPYQSNGKLISIKTLQNKFPLCWEYFQYNKSNLLPKALGGKRDTGQDTSKNEWYKFGRSQGLTGWNKDKLIVGVLSNGPSTAYDNKQMILASGGTAGHVPLFNRYSNSKYKLEYIEAWINYPLTDEMFKLQTTNFRGGYWTHGTNAIKKIPFLTINMKNSYQKSKYDKIVNIVKMINKDKNSKSKNIKIKLVNQIIGELIKEKDII